MTPADLTLARRAVACPRWRWMPGMALYRWSDTQQTWVKASRLHEANPEPMGVGEHLPDIADPATGGTLLALVREAWGTTAHIARLQTNVPDGQGGTRPACWWALALGLQSVPLLIDGRRYLAGPTEAEALIAALEAAP